MQHFRKQKKKKLKHGKSRSVRDSGNGYLEVCYYVTDTVLQGKDFFQRTQTEVQAGLVNLPKVPQKSKRLC